MSDYDVRMVVLSTGDLDESIRFYTETLGMKLKFRDGAHYAAIDGGSITIAPGQVWPPPGTVSSSTVRLAHVLVETQKQHP
jgi:catechol 2,3-dioxygenase-like lactoylglutathione lyase family enzyme